MNAVFYVIESSAIGQRASLRSQQRNDDLYLTNRTPTNLIEPGLFAKYEISVVHTSQFQDFMRTNPNDINIMLRSRADYHNRIHPDLTNVCN